MTDGMVISTAYTSPGTSSRVWYRQGRDQAVGIHGLAVHVDVARVIIAGVCNVDIMRPGKTCITEFGLQLVWSEVPHRSKSLNNGQRVDLTLVKS